MSKSIVCAIDKDLQQVYKVGDKFQEEYRDTIKSIKLVEEYQGKGLHNDITMTELVIKGDKIEVREVWGIGNWKLIYAKQ